MSTRFERERALFWVARPAPTSQLAALACPGWRCPTQLDQQDGTESGAKQTAKTQTQIQTQNHEKGMTWLLNLLTFQTFDDLNHCDLAI